MHLAVLANSGRDTDSRDGHIVCKASSDNVLLVPSQHQFRLRLSNDAESSLTGLNEDDAP